MTESIHMSHAEADPEYDYFEHVRASQPKKAIGQYVLENGFNVPLIEDATDYDRALSSDALFLRSELRQDYDGLGGLYNSLRVSDELAEVYHEPKATDIRAYLYGLREGKISHSDFMERRPGGTNWVKNKRDIYEALTGMGLKVSDYEELFETSVSAWRFIEGTRVEVFRDPNVDGRYHFGVTPYRGAVGDYMIEAQEHSSPRQFRKHKEPFIAAPFIDVYEAIRNLPMFDITQTPVMELVQDPETSEIYFLQYRKVNKKLQPIDSFDLVVGSDTFLTHNARGVTPQEGVNFRIAINPTRIADVARGRAFYADMFYMNDYEASPRFQIACKAAELAICQDSLSLKDNHTSSSPLYLPGVSLGLIGFDEQQSMERYMWFNDNLITSLGGDFTDKKLTLDVRVVSNGRSATIDSDWKVNSAREY